MPSLHLYSEPFRPGGNIDARAAKRAIGRPSLDHWEVFLRETLQNSWDARLSDTGPIDFSVDGWWASGAQMRTLREQIFPHEPDGLPLDKFLAEDEIAVLLVTDKGTRGLAGPTRADLTTQDRSDFVDFVRNIGRGAEKGYGGGTYGFGKGVLYDASDCATVVVFSRTDAGGSSVDRFMGMALGESFNAGGTRFTGRHWWGVEDAITGAEPVTGARAEALARDLGMCTIAPDETGTAILVVAPVAHEGETLEEIIEQIAEAATRWAWPHMLQRHTGPSIRFAFSCDGAHVPAPDPQTDLVLMHFTAAYERCGALLSSVSEPGDDWPWSMREVRSERPARKLGALAYRRYRHESVRESPFADVTSHVALMRDPRLVVRYLEVPNDPGGLATAGVFVADPELNDEFAKSEPVAHDDWVPENLRLEKYERNPVKQAVERLRKEFRQALRVVAGPEGGGRFTGITSLSSYMGDLLDGLPGGTDTRVSTVDGRRVGGPPEPSGGSVQGHSEGGRRARRGTGTYFTVGDYPTLLEHDGQIVAEFAVQLEVPGHAGRLRLTATPKVVVDSGTTEIASDAPLGVERPHIIGWTNEDGAHTEGDSVEIGPETSGRYTVRVHQPDDTAVTISIERTGLVP